MLVFDRTARYYAEELEAFVTADRQRICIAEACGWTEKGTGSPWVWYHSANPERGVNTADLPDYLRDLNACHEMEKVLSATQMNAYVDSLKEMVGERTSVTLTYSLWEVVCATAAQRAEAFLKTIGKWADEP